MIREAQETDCINLVALSLEVWIQTYSKDGIRTENSQYALSTFTETYFMKFLTNPNYRLLVFTEDIYLRGYALINLESRFEHEKNGFEIEKLYVQNAFQRQGIGQSLLSEIIARYGKRFWLYSWVRNASTEFYRKFGFRHIGHYQFTFENTTIDNHVFAYTHAERKQSDVHEFRLKTYKKRNINFLEQVNLEGWRMKIYGITAKTTGLPAALVMEGKNTVLPHLPQPAVTDQRYGVGFLIIHQGITENWFLLNWWGDENIIHQKIFFSSSHEPTKIKPVTDKSIMACVYELDIYHFEKNAWIDNVLSNVKDQDFEGYLHETFNTPT